MRLSTVLLLAVTILLAASCRKKDPPDTQPPTGQVALAFTNMAGGEPLVLDNTSYVNENGDTFTVSGYAYYISNISFSTSDGKTFAEPESYHLITETEDTSKSFIINNIPEGNYTSVKFLIGVDETRNTSGAQTGALDPMRSMFWDWNTGYIMAKVEGHSPQSPGPASFIGFHLGGFSGTESVLRWITLAFPEPLHIAGDAIPEVHITSDLLKWFDAPNVIDFSQTYIIMGPGEAATKIADNYADMFTISHIHK